MYEKGRLSYFRLKAPHHFDLTFHFRYFFIFYFAHAFEFDLDLGCSVAVRISLDIGKRSIDQKNDLEV